MGKIQALQLQPLVARCLFIRLSKKVTSQIISNVTYYKIRNYRSQKFLNTNKEIVAMCTGRLDPSSANDMLFIGSKTNLLAYGNQNCIIL